MPDDRTYIKVHDGILDHPKVVGLSDAAFRLLISMWTWSSRYLTDGRIPDAVWKRAAGAKVRAELEKAGLVEVNFGSEGGMVMHDYLEHQRSAAEVRELQEIKRTAGSRGGHVGNHRRWHVARGVIDPDCELCPAVSAESADGSAAADESDQQTVSRRSAKHHSETETETEGVEETSTPREPRKRGTRLPEKWKPSDETRTWTLERITVAEAAAELVKFRNYWLAKSGRDATKLDWERTWQNWIIRVVEDRGKQNGAGPKPPNPEIARMEALNRARQAKAR